MATPPSFRVRPMRLSDYRAVHALWARTEGMGLGESDDRASVGRFLARNPGLSLVATRAGRIVAAVLCGHDGRRGYLHHLAVSKGARRGGIGRSLVDTCLAGLHARGIPKCNLFLFTSNAAGRAFWRHMGWTVRADLRMVQRTTAVCGPCRRAGC